MALMLIAVSCPSIYCLGYALGVSFDMYFFIGRPSKFWGAPKNCCTYWRSCCFISSIVSWSIHWQETLKKMSCFPDKCQSSYIANLRSQSTGYYWLLAYPFARQAVRWGLFIRTAIKFDSQIFSSVAQDFIACTAEMKICQLNLIPVRKWVSVASVASAWASSDNRCLCLL